jgi:hypothetical protein
MRALLIRARSARSTAGSEPQPYPFRVRTSSDAQDPGPDFESAGAILSSADETGRTIRPLGDVVPIDAAGQGSRLSRSIKFASPNVKNGPRSLANTP